MMTCRHQPEVKQQQLFDFSLAQPFQKGKGWLAWGLIGVAAAPLVVGATALALSAVGFEEATSGGRGTVDGVAGMISMDTPTYVRLLTVTGERKGCRLDAQVTSKAGVGRCSVGIALLLLFSTFSAWHSFLSAVGFMHFCYCIFLWGPFNVFGCWHPQNIVVPRTA